MIFKIKNLCLFFSILGLLNTVMLWQGLYDAKEAQSSKLTFFHSTPDIALKRSPQNDYKKLTKLFDVPVLSFAYPIKLHLSGEELSLFFSANRFSLYWTLSPSNKPRAPPFISLNV